MSTSDRRATSAQPLHDLIAERWSPRAFDDRTVTKEQLRALFEAARWAPSCFNDQPWTYVVGVKGASDDGGAWQKVHDALVPPNQAWAHRAPVLAIAVARLQFAFNGKPNRHALYDTGAASMSLSYQAQAMGLVVHQMGGFDVDAARTAFGIEDTHDPIAALAIGYAAPASVLEGDLRERELAPRERRAANETFFGGTFGTAHPAAN
jgi:nitroreductase